MRAFRFRAQVVLDLRRREEEAARAALARHRALSERAWGLVQRARGTLAEAGAALAREAAGGAPHQTLMWHQSWITRLRREARAAAEAAAAADQAAAEAVSAVQRATQRRRVLERLHDRALRAYREARSRADLAEMNQLATVRFAHQAIEQGAHDDD